MDRSLTLLCASALLLPACGASEGETPTPSPVDTETPTEAPDSGATPTPGATPTDAPEATMTPTSGAGDAFWPSAACQGGGDHPPAWDDATHSKDADPDAAYLFDLTQVRRMDLRIHPDTFAAMQAELTELLGAFGEGGGIGGPGGEGPGGPGGVPGELPPELAEACVGLGAEDTCSVDLGGAPLQGACEDDGAGTLVCIPDMGGGFPGGPDGGEGGVDLVSVDPSYAPVEVELDGVTWCYAGMRYKGNSSLISAWSGGVEKLPFRLNMDTFEGDHPEIKNQRLRGYKKLAFGNGWGDDTYMREVLATEIFADRGVPVSLSAFMRVYLDTGEGPTYLGLYTLTEDPSDTGVERLFEEDKGNLYKPEGTCANLSCFDEANFEKKSNEEDADFSDVEALVAALAAEEEGEAFRAALEAKVDVDGFLRWLAVNSAIENWDTYGGMAHNYYLYGDPAAEGRLSWIPWDLNLSLMPGTLSTDVLHTQTGEGWPLIRRLLDEPTYMTAYQGHLATALEGAFAEDAFTARARALHGLITPYVVGGEGEVEGRTFITSEAAFESALEGDAGILAHMRSRHAAVEAALE